MTCANPGGRSLAYQHMHMPIMRVEKAAVVRVIAMIVSLPGHKKTREAMPRAFAF